MLTPQTNKPKIKQRDIDNGFVTRYFVRNVSTKMITEVDKVQYDKFKSNAFFETLELPWEFTGFANDTLATDNTIIYGTRHKNVVTTEFYNKRMPGLNRLLRNPLEYFQGVDNRTD